jgi:DNA-binding response OmpR family regulator
MRILIAEDDDIIGDRLRRSLIKEGYVVDWFVNGQMALDYVRSHEYSLVILDVMMPLRDGWSVCQSIRDSKNPVPILMLTAKDAIEDRVKGLDLGADDYLVKPFSIKELLARVRALTRRGKLEKSSIIYLADLEIETRSKIVKRQGEILHLTPREYSLLESLARNRGRTLSREYIIEQVWNDDQSLSNTVNFHVTALRKKIDVGRERSLIETIHGFGYRIQEGAE